MNRRALGKLAELRMSHQVTLRWFKVGPLVGRLGCLLTEGALKVRPERLFPPVSALDASSRPGLSPYTLLVDARISLEQIRPVLAIDISPSHKPPSASSQPTLS